MPDSTNYWLLKSEPSAFSWSDLVAQKNSRWDGVRNFKARNNLRAMKVGDKAFFYHSNAGKMTGIVGICRVVKPAEHDTTFTPEKDNPNPWVVVTVEPVQPLPLISLAGLRQTRFWTELELARYARLSVQSIQPDVWVKIMRMAADV
jgi:predicted RNA-binding protein with PUA-like domain